MAEANDAPRVTGLGVAPAIMKYSWVKTRTWEWISINKHWVKRNFDWTDENNWHINAQNGGVKSVGAHDVNREKNTSHPGRHKHHALVSGDTI